MSILETCTGTKWRNRVVQEGDTMTNPELADTLQAIADNGVDEFYTGQTAVNLVQDIQAGG